jgi:hypothetical protein
MKGQPMRRRRPRRIVLVDVIENPPLRKLRIVWSCFRVRGHEHPTYDDALHCSGEETSPNYRRPEAANG